jgi:hypothetical protein
MTRIDIARLLATAERAATLASSTDSAAECMALAEAGYGALDAAVLGAGSELAERVQDVAVRIGDRLIRAAERFCCVQS